MEYTGARIIVETLIEQGCKTVFGYPGGQVLYIYDELYKNEDRLNHVLAAHEQGAAHAADGYARATGEVGVCIATSGPGATNLVTGIATAYLDSTPMVAITGNVPCDLIGRDSFQEVDIMGVTLPITKHNYIVKDVNRLADTIREAFKIAKSGRPGPVLIDVPKDVQTNSCEFTPAGVVEPFSLPRAKDKLLDEAAKMIAEAKKPYIYCGGGVVMSAAGAKVLELAEKIDGVVGCSMMGLSAVPANNERVLGMQGMHGQFASSKAKSEADLLIGVGVRFSDRATGNKAKYASKAKIIHIDVDPAEIGKNVAPKLGIVGDVGDALNRLIAKVNEQKHPDWIEQVRGYKARAAVVKPSTAPLTPFGIIDAVAAHADADTPIVTDVGQHQMWVAQRYPFSHNRTFITSGGLGTMGFGLGAAIGAAFSTGKQTVLFTGDGCFGMNLNELATAVSYGVPVIVLIFNNGVLGMVRQWQTLFYNKHYSSTTLNRKTDFVKLAQAFGAQGYRATNSAELEQALKNAFESKTVSVIDCVLDKDECVFPMMPPGGSIEQLMLEKEEK